jgi:predicted ATPase
LLATTRAYALGKLAAGGEQESIAERHASFSIQMLESNPVNLFDLESTEAAANAVRDYLGNIRAALEWSFGPNGDAPTAIRLAAAASQLLLAMSLLLECRTWMEKAISRSSASDEDSGGSGFVAHVHRGE